MSSCCSSTFTWSHYLLKWAFHKSLSCCAIFFFNFYFSLSLIPYLVISFYMTNSSFLRTMPCFKCSILYFKVHSVQVDSQVFNALALFIISLIMDAFSINHISNFFQLYYKLKSKEPPKTFVPKILASSYPEWANCKGFLEPKYREGINKKS